MKIELDETEITHILDALSGRINDLTDTLAMACLSRSTVTTALAPTLRPMLLLDSSRQALTPAKRLKPPHGPQSAA